MAYKVFPIIVIACSLVFSSRASALPRDLMASASDQAIVLAHVQPPDKNDPDSTTDHTVILTRMIGKETRWRKLATLSGRVVSVAACNEDAKVLLDTGDWMTIWADGSAYGPPAPNVRLVAFAADGGTLWAIGKHLAPASQPTVNGKNDHVITGDSPIPIAATQPSTWPHDSALYRFDGRQWAPASALPADVDAIEPSALSLAIIDHQPVVATSNGGDGVRFWTGEVDAANPGSAVWSSAHQLSDSRPVINFEILRAGTPPTLWLTYGGPGTLADAAGEHALNSDGSAAGEVRSAIRAAEAIRLYAATGDRLFEQVYSSDGAATGKRAELVIDLLGPESEMQNWLAPTLTVILTMLLFGAARRNGLGELPTGIVEANLELAPLLPRFIAGAIDLLPVLVSILFVAKEIASSGLAEDVPTNTQMIPFYIGSGVYLVYTIGSELLFRKTLGKWIFGLQIVTIDGTRPSLAALLLRNVLRLVDLILVWLPLAMILFSPLRQRVADLAAGTLVVRTVEPPKTESI